MRKPLLLASVVLALTSSHAVGLFEDDDARIRWAANNASHECAVCAVFYQSLAECVSKEPNRAAMAAKFEKTATSLIIAATGFGEVAGIKQETIMARISMVKREFADKTNSSCANFSVILNEHIQKCKVIAEEPKLIFLHYLERAKNQ